VSEGAAQLLACRLRSPPKGQQPDSSAMGDAGMFYQVSNLSCYNVNIPMTLSNQ
jgi:hypothetical protein